MSSKAMVEATWQRVAWRGPLGALLCGLIAVIAATAPAACAADRIYWSNYNANSLSYANLNGSGGRPLAIKAGTAVGPMGIAIDSAAGRIYWANWGLGPVGDGKSISWANLNGRGGGTLFINPAFVNGPHGLAIDATTGKLYWPNTATNRISYANLNGSGAGNLKTGVATVNGPRGVAIDPKAKRIYWANWSGNRISYAKLDGSGGADLATGLATVIQPEGVALDPATRRVYWSNFSSANKISFANLNGSGGGDLATGLAPVNMPHGVAIDPATRRVYWPNFTSNSISYASLGGGGGAELPTPGVPSSEPDQPLLLKRPSARRRPVIKGGSTPRSPLRCLRARWAPDLPGSHLYRAPQKLSYRWIRNGNLIAGARSSILRDAKGGKIKCRVTARNAAGRASQTSRPHALRLEREV